MINNCNLPQSTQTLIAAQVSLEAAKEQSLKKADRFMGGFLATQKQGAGINATGVCAGYAIWGYRLLEQNPLGPLPVPPPKVPLEVTHLELQLPRAVMHILPRGVDPKSVKRGSKDAIITIITVAFQRFIREEADVGIQSILPGPGFGNYVEPASRSRFISYLFKDPDGETDQNSHYLFCLHKPGQLITEGHMFYAHLRQGIIMDAGFGPLVWKIEQTARGYFKSVLVDYLRKNYADWNLFVCRAKREPSTRYSKLPLMLRNSWTTSKLLFNIAYKAGIKTGVLLSGGLLIEQLTPSFISSAIRKKARTKECEHQFSLIDKTKNLAELFKDYETLALEYEQFSPINWGINLKLISVWIDPYEFDWQKIFEVMDHFDSRLDFLKSRILEELLERVYFGCVGKNSRMISPQQKRRNERAYLSWTQEILGRRNKLINKFSLNNVLYMAVMNQPKNRKFIELLLRYGANPNTPDHTWGSPLYLACQHRNPSLVRLLLEYKADLENPDHALFPLAAALGDKSNKPEAIKEIEKLLNEAPLLLAGRCFTII